MNPDAREAIETVEPARAPAILGWMEIVGGVALFVSYFLMWSHRWVPGAPGAPVVSMYPISTFVLSQGIVLAVAAGVAMLATPTLATLTGILVLRATRAAWGWAAELSFFWGFVSFVGGLCELFFSGFLDWGAARSIDIGALVGMTGILLILITSLTLLNPRTGRA